ncbi:ABC transporter ATP-binding protein [bacterium]|nr:ABC transporter ATP-binding protein [bacterium]
MVEVRDLVKSYGDVEAVSGVNFSVARGEVLGFLGPNGAGKTTTMRVITGFMPPTNGTVLVDGLDVVTDNLEVRRRIGYLPEHPPLYLEFTARENLEFAARLKGVPKDKRRERIAFAMDRCGLAHMQNRFASQMSKGYRQRLGLACAIVHDPEVLVLDEPTIGLDPVQIQEIRGLIRELGRDHTVILSTHILPEVVMTCRRVVIIHEGRIVADGPIEELTRAMHDAPRIAIRLAEPDDTVESRIGRVEGVRAVRKDAVPGRYIIEIAPGTSPANDIALEALNAGWGILEISDEAGSLEEVFVRLTSR